MLHTMLKTILLAVSLLAIVPAVASAEPCYTGDEVEADQALRYQAWLRVVGLSCSGYAQYQSFADKNQSLLQDYQNRLIHFYKAHYKGDAEARLHARESEASNEESLVATRGGTLALCKAHADELQRAAQGSSEDIKHEIAAFTISQPAAKRKCSR